MLRAIVGTSVRFRMLIIGIAGALLLIGATQVQSTRVDVLPEFSPPYVEVQTEALGLSAEEVEEFVTVPLDGRRSCHGVAFLERSAPSRSPGLSSIVLDLRARHRHHRARQVVAGAADPGPCAAQRRESPADAPTAVLARAGHGRRHGLAEKSLTDMSVLARWTVRPRLMGVPGVANVSICGQRERQLQVLVDPPDSMSATSRSSTIVETAGDALWFSPLSFLEGVDTGDGRLHRHAAVSGSASGTSCRSRTPRTSRGADRDRGWRHPAEAGRRRVGGRGSPAADRRRARSADGQAPDPGHREAARDATRSP